MMKPVFYNNYLEIIVNLIFVCKIDKRFEKGNRKKKFPFFMCFQKGCHRIEILTYFQSLLFTLAYLCLKICFVLFVLLLYVPSQQLWSLRDGQFT